MASTSFEAAVSPLRKWRFRPEVSILEARAVPASGMVLIPEGVSPSSVTVAELPGFTLELMGDAAVDEGTPYALTIGAASLPGGETIVGYAIRWGDGKTENIAGDPGGTVHTHPYANEALVRTITVDLMGTTGRYPAVATKDVFVRNVQNFLTVRVATTLTGDADGDGQADPGDLLTHVVTITNAGPDEASRVSPDYVPGTGSAFVDILGVFHGGQLFYDADANFFYDPAVDTWSWFGQAGDLPVSGRWSTAGYPLPAHGVDHSLAVFRAGTWYFDGDGNGFYDNERETTFGQAGDLPVAGAWTGGELEDIGVFRGGSWYFDLDGSRTYNAGDTSAYFGQAGNLPVTGDWNGDGRTEIGVFDDGMWYIDANGNGTWDPAAGDVWAYFGRAGDIPVVGDWNRDGLPEIGVFSAGTWYFDTNRSGRYEAGEDAHGWFGGPGDLPIFGPFSPVWSHRTMAPGEEHTVTTVTRIDPALDPGATEVIDRVFVLSWDSATQLGQQTDTEVVTPLHVSLPVPANPVIDLQASLRRIILPPGFEQPNEETWTVDFRNLGDLTATQVVVVLHAPPEVFWPYPRETWTWTEEGPGEFRLAIGPLAAHQGGTAPRLTLGWDPMNPPPLPLVLTVEIGSTTLV